MENNEKTSKRIGVFPGSFDPITLGHIDIIERASKLFDILYVVVSQNSEKKYLFDLGERLKFAKISLKDIKNVVVVSSDALTVEFCLAVGAISIVKGARSVKDFEDELYQSDINRAIGGMDTVLLLSKPEYSFISSSLVREMIKYGKGIDKFVHADVSKEILLLTKK